jgi:hypothetical protein
METTVICPASVVRVNPTITTGAAVYTAGDVVGGIQTLTSAVRTAGRANANNTSATDAGTAVLQSITVVDAGAQTIAYDIVFFSASPDASTTTDGSALSIAAADISKILGIVGISSTDYSTEGGIAIASKLSGLVFAAGADKSAIYAVAVTGDEPTYTTTTEVTFVYGFLQN